ncbi:murein L,D-transpeptidase catalytic domain family protein [Sphingosinithalassobacter sp. LHW66-3]|uniref:murein L,D-transpeptidase catalytic domain family protein n=1 Tax=Sphingosinithalassobacter sp. LHW66-3 TaxID=3424718 RepID=UPI003D6A7342
MSNTLDIARSRRALLRSALVVGGGALAASCTPRAARIVSAPAVPVPQPPVRPDPIPAAVATRPQAPRGVDPEIFKEAIAALDRHSMRIPNHDKIAIADFTAPSHRPRFHVINLGSGESHSVLVSHGSGSDPEHTGFLQRFSNVPGSNATSEGAYLLSEYYVGQHDRSQRLDGLDPTNDLARDRAIVIHGAWYSNPEMIARHGKLGRSQGCFALPEAQRDDVFAMLGQGRMIYSSRLA